MSCMYCFAVSEGVDIHRAHYKQCYRLVITSFITRCSHCKVICGECPDLDIALSLLPQSLRPQIYSGAYIYCMHNTLIRTAG
jgi:hypothetical protein